jgi:hypothetical protein
MPVTMKKTFGNQPREAAVEDGLYQIKLVQIGEPKMYPGFNGGPEQEKCRFVFEVTKDYDSERENDYRGAELSALVNINGTGPKSTLYQIVQAITGQKPEELGEFDLYELIHQTCKATVSVKFSEDGKSSYANIKEFMPLRPVGVAPKTVNGSVAQAAKPAAAKAAPKAKAETKPEVEEFDEDF